MKNLIYRYQIQKNIFKEKLSSTDLLNISLKKIELLEKKRLEKENHYRVIFLKHLRL